MYIDSTGMVNTTYWNQTVRQKTTSQKAAPQGNASSGAEFTLHIRSGNDNDKMLSAAAGRGSGGMTVFEPADFNPEQPVYKVCTWDEKGNRTERMVDVTNVDVHHSDEAEMFAYACYLSKSGAYPEASDTFLRTRGYFHEELSGGEGDGDPKTDPAYSVIRQAKKDWTKLAASIMQTQYECGNLKGYLEYKKFVDFFA